ncbi:hypothetical protein M405DRAFT_821789 [Rhizopogon salebrosus TDB-379]|nr:hypothetical protein M405DRAFT_821789 [Rhizopogon salebrosus TDB-379]
MRHFFQQIVERLNALEARTRSPGLSFDTPLAPSMPEFNLPTYELLSTQDGFTARRECRRMLVNLGVRVVLMYAGSTGVLKCTTDATKNLPGLPPTLTSVRFRVEVHGPTPAQIAVGYQVVLHLIQEGGSSLSFRSICNSLKRDWELDIPRIPRLLMPQDVPFFGHTETELGGYESDERFVCVD